MVDRMRAFTRSEAHSALRRQRYAFAYGAPYFRSIAYAEITHCLPYLRASTPENGSGAHWL